MAFIISFLPHPQIVVSLTLDFFSTPFVCGGEYFDIPGFLLVTAVTLCHSGLSVSQTVVPFIRILPCVS